ncbi:hypothetical protein JQS43_21285 [Natronosporangium hydrolyticum]|uniref:Uncharacterized protein n=1 Tax=Natronosporangium hydrolyticum TaxID=2811111 RepID=A0A895YCV7_9ACTN|nr:hypothetical protein [Natronosporangium hydrolyticum]QSB14045.1 hypothetical protein JQS43_21285 [Natronosporangium hydrolyticum]
MTSAANGFRSLEAIEADRRQVVSRLDSANTAATEARARGDYETSAVAHKAAAAAETELQGLIGELAAISRHRLHRSGQEFHELRQLCRAGVGVELAGGERQ